MPAAAAADRIVNLAETIHLLHDRLDAALCRTVFRRVRSRERQRRWTLLALARFWITVLLTAPRSLTQALEQAGLPTRMLGGMPQTTPEAFFQRCARLRPDFFSALYEAFVARLLPDAPAIYASPWSGLRSWFPEVWVLDGTRLDAVAHRLRLTWDVRSPLLPGCLLVLYDLFRGFGRIVAFCGDAAASELSRAHDLLPHIPRDTLVVGDRLFASVAFCEALTAHHLWGVFRRNRRLRLRHDRWLARQQGGGAALQDRVVWIGCGVGTPPQLVRHIRYSRGRTRLELLTTVLDPTRLSAEEALSLYRARWTVERLFYDLKEVLDLHHFYLASPRGVAHQVYAAAMVYTAMRCAQARIAQAQGLEPEQLSPAKLFPRVAAASLAILFGEAYFLATQKRNPGVTLVKPTWEELPASQVRLSALLVEMRRGKRRKRRYCASRRHWKSFAHIRGGRKLS